MGAKKKKIPSWLAFLHRRKDANAHCRMEGLSSSLVFGKAMKLVICGCVCVWREITMRSMCAFKRQIAELQTNKQHDSL